jgi:AsmA protein
VADGVAATDNVRLLNPYVRLFGSGLINIGAQSIDMRLEPRAVNTAQGQGGEANVAGYGIPFRVSGPWSRVQFRPAVEEIVQSQLRDILARQDQGNPLTQLGQVLFGNQPPTTTETPAETPAQQPADGQAQTPQQQPEQQQQQQQPSNPLADIFRRAMQGDEEEEKQEPAPTP